MKLRLVSGAAVLLLACSSRPPSPNTACTATGGLDAGASLAPDPGRSPTGSRYIIPFAGAAPARSLFVAPSGDDANSGSAADPLKTIQAAFDQATPGTAVLIGAGTYRENVKLSHSGEPGAPIWLVGVGGPSQVFVAPADETDSTIQGYAVHDLVLQGLDVTGPSQVRGDSDGIKLAANGDVSVAANRNARIAVLDCRVHTPVTGGYNGVKISSADQVFVVHTDFDGAGREGDGDALDLVGNTNSEVAFCSFTGVPRHAAAQLKGGSTTIAFHHNVIAGNDADGLWVGGGTLEEFMYPSTAYEACNVDAASNVVSGGRTAVHFVGGVNSTVRRLFAFGAGSRYLQLDPSDVHRPAIETEGNVMRDCVFEATQDVLTSAELASGKISADSTNVAMTVTDNATGNQTFTGGGLIRAGGGHDTFLIAAGQGTTLISGFQTGSDVISLQGVGYTGFADVQQRAHQVGTYVVLELPDGAMLVLENVQAGALVAATFVFP